MRKQVIASVLCLGLAASLLSGCGNNDANNTAQTEGPLISEVTTSDTYPISTDVELDWWVNLNANVAAYASSMNETYMAEYMQEETGIKVNFIHPATGQETEKFNLMVASRDMEDIVEYGWSGYSGGPDKAISDQVIYPLDEVLEKVSPNLKKYFEENPQVAGQVQTVSGQYYMYPFVTKDPQLRVFMGFMIRKDLLDQAGLALPETLDEWETALAAFKDMGLKSPISIQLSQSDTVQNFMGAFGIMSGWYVEDGKVKYGQYEPAYRDTSQLWRNGTKRDGLIQNLRIQTTREFRLLLSMARSVQSVVIMAPDLAAGSLV